MTHNDHHQPPPPEPADIAMTQVLQAERDAERAVADCEQEARDILKAAHLQAQRIAARTNQRISMLQVRHGQKLNQAIKEIELAGQRTALANNTNAFDATRFRDVIDELAAELTTGETGPDKDPRT